MMVPPMVELRCDGDLAKWLGAIEPEDHEHHKRLRELGHMVVRDYKKPRPMFWPWLLNPMASRST